MERDIHADQDKIYISRKEYDDLQKILHDETAGVDFDLLTASQQEVFLNDSGFAETDEEICNEREVVIYDDDPGKLDPITVRFPHSVMLAIRDLAEENGCSIADLIRWSLESGLTKYLNTVRFMDYEQGEEIRDDVRQAIRKISDLEVEIKREGNNLNQMAKDFNAASREGNGAKVTPYYLMMIDEFQRKQDAQMKRYEEATKEVGDKLCRILT